MVFGCLWFFAKNDQKQVDLRYPNIRVKFVGLRKALRLCLTFRWSWFEKLECGFKRYLAPFCFSIKAEKEILSWWGLATLEVRCSKKHIPLMIRNLALKNIIFYKLQFKLQIRRKYGFLPWNVVICWWIKVDFESKFSCSHLS